MHDQSVSFSYKREHNKGSLIWLVSQFALNSPFSFGFFFVVVVFGGFFGFF